MKDLQKKINDVYTDIFSYTPQSERISDITNQFFKLMRNTGVKDLKECTGDLLTSLIQLCSESDWDVNTLVDENLNKVEKRKIQYKTLGRKKRIAIYGGAFDCIHNGHIESAKFILNSSGYFDEVWLMPAFSHIYNKKMTDSKHRIKMCELASKVDNRIKVFDYEIKHELGGETYRLVKMLINDTEFDNFDFSFVMGIDNANTFHKWVNYEHLEKMMKFVIIPRKGYKADENVKWFLSKPHIFMNDEINNVPEISSTEIKKMIKNKLDKELEKYLNPDVIKYIKDNNLYEIK